MFQHLWHIISETQTSVAWDSYFPAFIASSFMFFSWNYEQKSFYCGIFLCACPYSLTLVWKEPHLPVATFFPPYCPFANSKMINRIHAVNKRNKLLNCENYSSKLHVYVVKPVIYWLTTVAIAGCSSWRRNWLVNYLYTGWSAISLMPLCWLVQKGNQRRLFFFSFYPGQKTLFILISP